MKKKRIIRVVLLVLILIWMMIVFSFSNQNGTQSSGISSKIAEFLFPNVENKENIEIVIRKIAHLSEYALGGVLFLLLLFTYDISENKKIIFSWLISVEYAVFDEMHQLFIDGRAGKLIDVIIDSIGAGIGICGLMLCYKILKIFLNRKIQKCTSS